MREESERRMARTGLASTPFRGSGSAISSYSPPGTSERSRFSRIVIRFASAILCETRSSLSAGSTLGASVPTNATPSSARRRMSAGESALKSGVQAAGRLARVLKRMRAGNVFAVSASGPIASDEASCERSITSARPMNVSSLREATSSALLSRGAAHPHERRHGASG